MKACYHHWKIGRGVTTSVATRWERDYEMIQNEGLFEEYLEMGKTSNVFNESL